MSVDHELEQPDAVAPDPAGPDVAAVPDAVPAEPGRVIRTMTADDPDQRPAAAEVAEKLTPPAAAVTPVGRHRRHRYLQRRRHAAVVDQLRGITFGAAGNAVSRPGFDIGTE